MDYPLSRKQLKKQCGLLYGYGPDAGFYSIGEKSAFFEVMNDNQWWRGWGTEVPS